MSVLKVFRHVSNINKKGMHVHTEDSGSVTVVFSSSSVRGPYGSAIDHVLKMFRAHVLPH